MLPDSQNRAHDEQLMAACVEGDPKLVESLIKSFHDRDAGYEPPYQSMLKAAVRHSRPGVVRYCLNAGARIFTCIALEALCSWSFEMYELLVSAGLDINEYVPWHGPFLILAAEKNDLRWACFCLERGADPNLHMTEDSKKAITVAAESASVEMAALLLDHGALIEGSGAIVMAAEAGRLDMVKFLLERGADINEIGLKDWGDNRADADMGSALHKAVTEGHIEIVDLLLAYGADINLPDFQRRTPLMRAKGIVLKAHGAQE
ncbi:MAG: hypothetical protein M1816_005540 [Peltula sp. TS41687]|nr:MAG: hypothetical protein M1816_005540 [Peltula sp. TS41687]